jgi:hypothetical protein
VHIPAAAWIAPRLRRFRFFDQELAADLGTIHGSVITYTYHEWPPPNPPVNPAFSAALKRKVQQPRKNDTHRFPDFSVGKLACSRITDSATMRYL